MENEKQVPAITDEQKQKFKKLQRSFAFRMAGVGAKFGLTLLVANFIVCLIDVLYVNNQAFAFLGGMISAIFAFRAFRLSLAKEHDRVKEEVKKILENK